MNKVTIEKLPDTKEILGAKRWEEERGEFVQTAYQEGIYHLDAFEIRKRFSRGNHYHEKKEEIFYGLEKTVVIEYRPQVYDKEDSYKINTSTP